MTATSPGLRYDQWKAVFMEQQAHGFDVWAQPLVQLRLPMLFNLRSDPFERAQHEAGDYVRWFVEHAFVLLPAQALVGQHLQSFQQFPPRQRPGSFSVEQAMEKLQEPAVEQLAVASRLKETERETDHSSRHQPPRSARDVGAASGPVRAAPSRCPRWRNGSAGRPAAIVE